MNRETKPQGVSEPGMGRPSAFDGPLSHEAERPGNEAAQRGAAEARARSDAKPVDKASRAEKKALSRRRILDSARDVFFRDEFMAANLDEVADRAGVAKGTLYRYFDSKADLYVAVLADNGEAFTDRMRDLASKSELSGLDQLRTMSRFYFEYWQRHPEYFQIFWAIDNQAVIGELPEPVVDEVAKLWERSLIILQGVLDRAVADGDLVECDTWEVANILWTAANALIQSESSGIRRRLRRQPIESAFHSAIGLIIRGLVRKSGSATSAATGA